MIDDTYIGTITIRDHFYNDNIIKVRKDNALDACLACEEIGMQEIEKLLPDWAIKALENGWAPRSFIR